MSSLDWLLEDMPRRDRWAIKLSKIVYNFGRRQAVLGSKWWIRVYPWIIVGLDRLKTQHPAAQRKDDFFEHRTYEVVQAPSVPTWTKEDCLRAWEEGTLLNQTLIDQMKRPQRKTLSDDDLLWS